MKDQLNEMINMALNILEETKITLGKSEIKIYLNSIEQILKQMKETNNKHDRNQRSEDTQ